jgi:hypothetical protein
MVKSTRVTTLEIILIMFICINMVIENDKLWNRPNKCIGETVVTMSSVTQTVVDRKDDN